MVQFPCSETLGLGALSRDCTVSASFGDSFRTSAGLLKSIDFCELLLVMSGGVADDATVVSCCKCPRLWLPIDDDLTTCFLSRFFSIVFSIGTWFWMANMNGLYPRLKKI